MGGKMKKDTMNLKPVATGLLTAVMVGTAAIILLTGLILNQRIGEELADKTIFAALLLSSFLGATVARLTGASEILYIPVGTCAIFASMLMIVGMLLFDGSFTRHWLSLCMIAVGCAIACSLRIGGNKRKRKRN